MSTSIYWVKKQLSGKLDVKVKSENSAEFEFNGSTMILYCPTSDEYEITSEVVLKANKLKANVIAFPTSWCRATREAIEYGKTLDIQIIPFGKFFEEYVK